MFFKQNAGPVLIPRPLPMLKNVVLARILQEDGLFKGAVLEKRVYVIIRAIWLVCQGKRIESFKRVVTHIFSHTIHIWSNLALLLLAYFGKIFLVCFGTFKIREC